MFSFSIFKYILNLHKVLVIKKCSDVLDLIAKGLKGKPKINGFQEIEIAVPYPCFILLISVELLSQNLTLIHAVQEKL